MNVNFTHINFVLGLSNNHVIYILIVSLHNWEVHLHNIYVMSSAWLLKILYSFIQSNLCYFLLVNANVYDLYLNKNNGLYFSM